MTDHPQIPPGWQEDMPLPSIVHERFASGIALLNLKGAQSMRLAAPHLKATSAKSKAWQLARHPAISARIAFLKRDKAEAETEEPVQIDKMYIETVMSEITSILSGVAGLLDRLSASARDSSSLRRAQSVIASRRWRIKTGAAEAVTVDADADEFPDWLTPRPICTCGAP